MKQSKHSRPQPALVYPWELSEETRKIGRAGLAKVRSVLKNKTEGPAQQTLALDFNAAAAAAAAAATANKKAAVARVAAGRPRMAA